MTDETPVVVIERAVTVRRSARREFVLRIPEFRAAAGGITAITGPSGSGKSTFLDLLLGLISPSSGSISIDGLFLSGDVLAHWQSCVAYVAQNTYIFSIEMKMSKSTFSGL